MGEQLDLFAAVREAERLAIEARQTERDKEARAQRLRALQQLQTSEARTLTDNDAAQLQAGEGRALEDSPQPQAGDAAPLHGHVPASLSPARRRAWIELCRDEAHQQAHGQGGDSAEPRGA